ncbi:MAG: septum site-determining protein MinC [Ardenticatenaceae bacterium]
MSQIGVKGDREGLIVSLPAEGSNTEVIEALQAHMALSGAFFKGAAVTLDVGERDLGIEELRLIGEFLGEWEVDLNAVRGSSESSRKAALALGLELPFVAVSEPPAAQEQRQVTVPEESIEALLVRRTLRSGQVVRHPGAVVVLGDVNPGAEIVAGGDIVVWGTLRGVVHAGAMGDDQATVCALHLLPTQLRISDLIAVAPEEKGHTRLRFWQRLQQSGPERARLHEGEIVVESWPGREMGLAG